LKSLHSGQLGAASEPDEIEPNGIIAPDCAIVQESGSDKGKLFLEWWYVLSLLFAHERYKDMWVEQGVMNRSLPEQPDGGLMEAWTSCAGHVPLHVEKVAEYRLRVNFVPDAPLSLNPLVLYPVTLLPIASPGERLKLGTFKKYGALFKQQLHDSLMQGLPP
jgi:hypothetical protein